MTEADMQELAKWQVLEITRALRAAGWDFVAVSLWRNVSAERLHGAGASAFEVTKALRGRRPTQARGGLMTWSDSPHVIWDNLTPREAVVLSPEEQLILRCKHCGNRYVLPLPCSVGLVAAVSKQYMREHRRCKPRSCGANEEAR